MMKFARKIPEYVLHLALWALLLAMSFSFTNIVFTADKALQISFLRVLTLAGVAYAHALLIIPRLFRKGLFVWYILSILALIFLSLQTNNVIIRHLLHGEKVSLPFAPRPDSAGYAPQLFLTVVILFISLVYALAKEFLKKEQQASALEKEKIRHELNFLRSQINPHFLFNALNNLHAVVQLRPQRAAAFVLKLGDMLRYVMEDCSKEKVSLADEIQYLEHYIFFQKQKDESLEAVQLDVSGDDPASFYLEPMLFIALVENAFMHSYTGNAREQYIAIKIHLENETLRFTICNNLPQDGNSHPKKGRKSGMGLHNVQRRLELLYPERHHFEYGSAGSEYRAELIIKKQSDEAAMSDHR